MAERADAPGPAAAQLDRGRLAWIVFGVAAFVGGTLLGGSAGVLDTIVSPPAAIRAAFVGASVVAGLAAVARSIRCLGTGRNRQSDELTSGDVATLVRGARYVFLAVAAFAAGGGWLFGHPLLFIVALVIAGVDVLETSFLLLVVAFQGER